MVGFALIIGLFGIAKRFFNKQGKTAQKLSAGAYGVFIIHPPILVGISAIFVNWGIPQLLKFAVLAPLVLLVSFAIAVLLKRIPVAKKIL